MSAEVRDVTRLRGMIPAIRSEDATRPRTSADISATHSYFYGLRGSFLWQHYRKELVPPQTCDEKDRISADIQLKYVE
jgi:hypothetical protein